MFYSEFEIRLFGESIHVIARIEKEEHDYELGGFEIYNCTNDNITGLLSQDELDFVLVQLEKVWRKKL